MAIQVTSEGKESLDDFQGARLLPGRYHVVLDEVEEPDEGPNAKHPDSLLVRFEVLKGTMPGQEGKKFVEFFTLRPKPGGSPQETERKLQFCCDRVAKLAMILDLIGPNEKKDVDFREAAGRSFIVEVEDNEYKGRKNTRIVGMNMWPVDDEEVGDVPKDPGAVQFLEESRKARAEGKPAPKAKRSAKQETQTAAATQSQDDSGGWGDL